METRGTSVSNRKRPDLQERMLEFASDLELKAVMQANRGQRQAADAYWQCAQQIRSMIRG